MKTKNFAQLLAMMLVLAMVFAVAAGCQPAATTTTPEAGGETEPAGETAAPAEGEATEPAAPLEIAVQIGSEPLSIDPNAEIGNDVITMNGHMWEPLYKRGPGDELMPGQAESCDISDDGTVYTFHLRGDIFWSDGEPVTANDFVYSWRRLVTGGYDYSSFLDNLVNAVDIRTNGADVTTLGVEATDDKTLVVTLTAPCAYFLEVCAYGVTVPVRQDIIEANGDAWCLSPETFISNGAYKLVEWVNQEKIVTEKNEYYYDKAAVGPDKITWLFMDDDNASLTAFESGDIMFTDHYPSEEQERLQSAGVWNVQPQIGTYYIEIESSDAKGVEVLQDVRVRRALALAFDRNYIVEKISKGGEIPADAWLPDAFENANGDNFRDKATLWWDNSTYEANCEEAKQLMADAGYPNGEGFPVVTYMINSSSSHQAIGEYMQSCWKEVLGIDVRIESQEWGVFLDTRSQGAYEMARAGWTVDFHDPSGLMDLFVSSDGNNDSHWVNEEYDALIAATKVETDASKRYDLIHQAEDILRENMAMIPVYYYTNKYLMDSNLYDGFFADVDGYHFQYVTMK